MEKIFDVVLVYETNFQKTIVEKLIEEKYKDSDSLLIDARNHQIRIYETTYNVNLGGLRWIARSITDIQKLPKIYTKELIGTHFTGINCRFFESYIDYEVLSLIDDGIGTPAILRNEHFVKTPGWFFRLLCANFLMLALNGRRLKTVKELISRISNYYTIYNFISNSYCASLTDKVIYHLNYYDGYKDIKVINGLACYIGSWKNPYIEQCLKYVRKRHNKIYYFPHPGEKVSDTIRQVVDEVVRPDSTIEDYFKKNGIPEFVYGSMSSVFLNIKLSGIKSKITVFSTLDNNNTYSKIYVENGINLINAKLL